MSLTLHTTEGDLKIELECERVPVLSRNFLALAAAGRYNGVGFHRNVKGYLVQGGDPSGTGKGGESIAGGTLPHELVPGLTHSARGVVSMAANAAGGNGSQFFITYGRQPSLDGCYSVIGRVVGGWETLDALESVPASAPKYRPERAIAVKGVTVHANPFAEEDILRGAV